MLGSLQYSLSLLNRIDTSELKWIQERTWMQTPYSFDEQIVEKKLQFNLTITHALLIVASNELRLQRKSQKYGQNIELMD